MQFYQTEIENQDAPEKYQKRTKSTANKSPLHFTAWPSTKLWHSNYDRWQLFLFVGKSPLLLALCYLKPVNTSEIDNLFLSHTLQHSNSPVQVKLQKSSRLFFNSLTWTAPEV